MDKLVSVISTLWNNFNSVLNDLSTIIKWIINFWKTFIQFLLTVLWLIANFINKVLLLDVFQYFDFVTLSKYLWWYYTRILILWFLVVVCLILIKFIGRLLWIIRYK